MCYDIDLVSGDSLHNDVYYVNLLRARFTWSVSVNAAMTLAELLSLNTMESLQNGLHTHSGVTPYSMREVSLASSQH